MSADWLLSYPGVQLPFGTLASGYSFYQAPDVGTQSVVADDFTTPTEDGRAFGSDAASASTVTVVLDVLEPTEQATRERVEAVRRAWRADAIRRQPGAVASLTSGRGRTTFGRPRRFTTDYDHIQAALARVTADFATATDLWFGDAQAASVGLVPVPSGGLVAPLSAPLATTESSDRSQAIDVGGELPTWLSVTIEGPITNPVVEIVGHVRWEFRTTLAYDQTLTVDASPWARTILRDGAAVPGTLTPQSTRLAKALIPPGSHEFVLRGTSSTGAARAVASWRPAFHTP